MGSQRVGHDWVTELNWWSAHKVSVVLVASLHILSSPSWVLLTQPVIELTSSPFYRWENKRRELQSPSMRWRYCVSDLFPSREPNKRYVYVWTLSCVRFFVTPWTVALQAPLSMEFSRQEYWSGPFPTSGDFLTQGSNPCLLYLLHWEVNSLSLCHYIWKPICILWGCLPSQTHNHS